MSSTRAGFTRASPSTVGYHNAYSAPVWRAPGLDLFHQLGDLGLSFVAEFAQPLDNAHPVFERPVLVEFLLAFQAEDREFKTHDRLELGVDVDGGRIGDFPGSRERG